MSDEIVNRVANSQLMTIDLEDFYPEGQRTVIDIKKWLFQELILKEADFRESVNAHDWEQYRDHYIALSCSSDAIIPSWAFMLITTAIAPYAKKVVVGDLVLLETIIFQDILTKFPVQEYKEKPVIIKGCTHKPIPQTAYIQLITKLQTHVKSILFGEACSTVPLFKKKL